MTTALATRSALAPSAWIQYRVVSETAPFRLFCFPYVGGAASVFRKWPQRIGEKVEVCPMQFPGRENRMSEPPIGDLREVVRLVADLFAPSLEEKPYALFGHSMGGLVAFELAREIRRRGLPRPVRLFMSASCAPQVADFVSPPRHLMSDEELVEELRRLGGTPEELLREEELLRLLLPAIKADFSLFDTYRYTAEEPLSIPITVFGGLEDFALPEEKLESWRVQTSAQFGVKMFPGDHFFLNAYEAAVTREIARLLG